MRIETPMETVPIHDGASATGVLNFVAGIFARGDVKQRGSH